MSNTTLVLTLFLTACAAQAVAAPASAPAGDGPKLPYYQPSGADVPLIELKSFDKATVEGFVKKFRELDERQTSAKPGEIRTAEIWVRIHSHGGSVAGGETIIHILEGAKSQIVCVADFRAMSMGFEVLESPGCDLRLMTPRATLMAHEVQIGGLGGGPGEIEDYLAYVRRLSDAGLEMAAQRMGISMAFMRMKTERRMWFLDAREAAEYNAIDGFADPRIIPDATPFEVRANPLMFLFGAD